MSYLYDVCKRIAFRRIPPPGAEVCNCYIVGYMKKLLFLSFFGLFLLACTTDEGDGAPFVTDVVMPPSSQLFAPGDEVTVAARGFEADDDIMLRIAWPLSQAALPEGYADGVWAVVTERTESDITFLAPGGYPASTTEVKLFRRTLECEKLFVHECRDLCLIRFAHVPVVGNIPVESARNYVYIVPVFNYAVHSHFRYGHIRTEHDALGTDSLDYFDHCAVESVRGEIEKQILRFREPLERIAEILGAVRASDVRDYDLCVLIFFFDFEHLCQINGIAQAKRTRYVEHYLRAELVA